jgi:hypothetical protein
MSDDSGTGSAMEAEFDTVAAWTADVALDLGPEHHVPAGCRGSGGPAALRWFLGHLRPDPGTTFLDVGAGVGGPAAFAAEEAGVLPVLTEPQGGACRAARRREPAPRPGLRRHVRLVPGGPVHGRGPAGVRA